MYYIVGKQETSEGLLQPLLLLPQPVPVPLQSKLLLFGTALVIIIVHKQVSHHISGIHLVSEAQFERDILLVKQAMR